MTFCWRLWSTADLLLSLRPGLGDEAEGEEGDNDCWSKLRNILSKQVNEVPPGFQLGAVTTLGLDILDGERPDEQIYPFGIGKDLGIQGETIHQVLPGLEGGRQDELVSELEGALDDGHHGVDGGVPGVQVLAHQPHQHLPALEHCYLKQRDA